MLVCVTHGARMRPANGVRTRPFAGPFLPDPSEAHISQQRWASVRRGSNSRLQHVEKAGYRPATVHRGSNSRLRRHLLLWTDYVSPRTFASHTTAGSRQPLLLREARSVRNARFAIHQRTSARAAGDRPPWCNRSNVARNCIANGRVRTTRFPRGADAPRSCVGVRTFAGGTATFAVHKRTCTRAAGVSPPWFGDANAVPRASYIVQQRPNTQSRAAGVRPPWCGHTIAVP
jgi:hypothetical protein